MSKVKRFLKRALEVVGFLAVLLWVLNTNLFVSVSPDAAPKLLSHRGVHQTYAGNDRSNTACTAAPVHPITHQYIENTVPSMRAAAEAGADVIELDVHLTPDGVLAVFHDWKVGCRTDGTGVTHDLRFDQLKALDIGYGYTADGTTFPLRGTGLGLMPSLREVLEAQIGAQFLINFKSRRAEEGTAVAALLGNPAYQEQVWGVYGGLEPTAQAASILPKLRSYDKRGLVRCLTRYLAIGWSGYVPEACRNTVVGVPVNYTRLIWGWPHRFTQRMNAAGTDVILFGPYDGSGFSSGIDTEHLADQVPADFDGYVWTNKIETIGPYFVGLE